MTDREALREKVARAMWMADIEPYDPANRIPFEEAMGSARAYVYAEADAAIDIVLEEAARMIETRWQHGTGDHQAAAIRAMKD
jgi:hypothetical protein